MPQRAYLDYYGAAAIIPVHQDTRDFAGHVRRRAALYRALRLPEIAFRNSTVLEFGPGTGDNARATSTFGPAEYVLFDGNPASIQAIQDKMAAGELNPAVCTVVEGDFLAPAPDSVASRTFDIVLAEGCIPYQRDPAAAVRHVAEFVRPGGVLVITTTDQVSMLSEICRRYYKPAIMRLSGDDFDAALELSSRVYGPQLAHLPAASRPVEDWVLDNILHPWGTTWALSIGDAIAASPELQFLGSSPDFAVDWRWYKTFADTAEDWNQPASAAWMRVSPYTLDWRAPYEGPLPASAGLDVARLARRAADLIEEDWANDSYDRSTEILGALGDLGAILAEQGILPGVQSGIAGFAEVVQGLNAGDVHLRVPAFDEWWGRGMQYVSFTRSAG